MPVSPERPTAPPRTTEGPRAGAQARGKGGRPKGSKNRPKSLIPTELANEILLRMEDMLPEEHFQYMKSVIRDGKSISTKRELDALILLLSRNLLPALVAETMPARKSPATIEELSDTVEAVTSSGDLMPTFRRDVTERLKVLNSLLGLRHQIEKADADAANDDDAVLKIFAGKRIDPRRLVVLVGQQPGSLDRGPDGAGWGEDGPRAIPDQVPERPLDVPGGEEE